MKTRLLKWFGVFSTSLLFASCCVSPHETVQPAPQTPPVVINPDRETPEACYAAFRVAWNSRDFDTAFSYLSPRAEEFIGAGHAAMIGLWQGMGTREMRESPFGQALERLLAERGIRSVGRRMKQHLGPGEDDEDRHVDALLATGRDLGPPLAFTKSLYSLDVEHNANNRLEFFSEQFRYGPMSEVNINGDTALGWFGMWELIGELSVEFIRTEEGWLIDMIYPAPLEEPNGNRYRDPPDSDV